jgi:hypothetical protein
VDAADRRALVTAVQTAGTVRRLELAFRGLDGTTLWAIFSARVLDHDGEPVRLTVVQDIARRQAAETALVENPRPLQHLAEADGRMTFLNQTLRNVTGRHQAPSPKPTSQSGPAVTTGRLGADLFGLKRARDLLGVAYPQSRNNEGARWP